MMRDSRGVDGTHHTIVQARPDRRRGRPPARRPALELLDQVLEGGESGPSAFTGGDHDLLVVVVGHVAGGEHPAHARGAVLSTSTSPTTLVSSRSSAYSLLGYSPTSMNTPSTSSRWSRPNARRAASRLDPVLAVDLDHLVVPQRLDALGGRDLVLQDRVADPVADRTK